MRIACLLSLSFLLLSSSSAFQRCRIASIKRDFYRGRLAKEPLLAAQQDVLWPALSEGTPLSSLPKELDRITKFASPDQAPGVLIKDIKAKLLKEYATTWDHFLSVNLSYPGLRLVHVDPPVFVIEDFLTDDCCDEYISLSDASEDIAMQLASPTFNALAETRTSTTWFLRYSAVRDLVTNAGKLLDTVDTAQFEEPQLVRYEPGQQFRWHLDQVPEALLDNGGQRVATLLVYLNDLDPTDPGGATSFRELQIQIRPRKGMALLFFPAFSSSGCIGGDDVTPGKKANKKKKSKKQSKEVVPLNFVSGEGDERTLHAGSAPFHDTKWIAQMWTHQSPYEPKVPPGNSH